MSRRVALVIHALHGGGAERVAATMANLWADQGDRVTVITLDTVESDVYSVVASVRRVGLGMMKASPNKLAAVWNNRRRITALRQAIRDADFDCVVSLTDRMNIVTLLACQGLPVPVVIAEHSDPRHQQLGAVWERLRRKTYPNAAALVVLTNAVAEHLRAIVGECPIYVIPNGIARPVTARGAVTTDGSCLMVAMGRLSVEKGFDRLIDAFARVAVQRADWRLEIAGEGPERISLERRIAQRRIESRATLIGWLDDPALLLTRADIFVLASRYEGFPVALLEAMAQGVAVISFDCDSGPREIIQHEQNGLLVDQDDIDQLAQAMERLIDDSALRRRLGQAACAVADRFSVTQFAQRWNDVLQDVLHAPDSNATSRQS